MWTLVFGIISILISYIEGGCKFPDHLQGNWVRNTVTDRFLYNFTEENVLLARTEEPTQIIDEQECVYGSLQQDDDLFLAYRGREDEEYKCAKVQSQENVLFLSDSYELDIAQIISELGASNVTTCSRQSITDLVFVVDTSGSICAGVTRVETACDNWFTVLRFASEIVESLDVGPNGTRVGFVSFGNNAYDEFFLNDHMTKEDIQNAILDVPFREESTSIAAGIRKMHKEQFTPERGDRPNVQNIAIVITDGQSVIDIDKTKQNAADAKADGINIFAIGVTSDINEDELRSISSEPQEINTNYFLAANFSLLSSILEGLVKETCISAGGQVKKCLTQSLDVVFAIDTAELLNETAWQNILTFTADMAKEIESVSFISVRFGTLLYHSEVYYTSYFSQFNNTEALIQDLTEETYFIGSRSTSSSYRKMDIDMFNQDNGDRDYAPDVVIMLTHGTSNMDANRTLYDAFTLRSRDIHVYTVAVTSSVNVYEVKYTSSYPHEMDASYWMVNQFSDLAGITSLLVEQICDDFSLAENPTVDPQICMLATYTGSPKLLNKYPVEEPQTCIFANNSAYGLTIRSINQDMCTENKNSRAVVYDDIMYLESCDEEWELQNEVFWCIGGRQAITGEVTSEDVQYFFKPEPQIGKYYCSHYTNDGVKTSLSLHINDQGSLSCSEEPLAEVIAGDTRMYTIELTEEAQAGSPPEVTSIMSAEGPISGGTIVDIQGSFGNTKGSIFLVKQSKRILLTVTSWTDTSVTGVTPPSDGLLGDFLVSVSIPGQPITKSSVTFTFFPDPVVFRVFPQATVVAGGTLVTVVGKGFDHVSRALLHINMERRLVGEGEEYEVIDKTTFTSDIADRVNDTEIVFTTPPITLPPDFPYLITNSRRKRQAPDSNQYLGFDADVQLDGVLARYTLENEEEPINMRVLDPYFDRSDDVIKFDGEKETFLEIKGGNLTTLFGSDAYHVVLGTGRCEVTNILNNALFCAPPREEPSVNQSLNSGGKDLPVLQVQVGFSVFRVGYVDYVRKTEFTYFIVGLAVLAVGTVVLLIIWTLSEKLRKRKKIDKF